MANIDDKIQAIREAIYGEEVRGAIADGIEAMNRESSSAYTQAVSSQTSAAASAVAASGYASEAEQSKNDAITYVNKSKSWAVGPNGSSDQEGSDTNNAKYFSQQAEQAANAASDKAKSWAVGPNGSSDQEGSDTNNAKYFSQQARQAATAAATEATANVTSMMQSYINAAKSWAIGPNGTQTSGSDNNNAYYWYLQAKSLVEGLSGNSLIPMGTITFSQLPTNDIVVGMMYNISNEFVTDARFAEGAGHVIPPGANVYWTAQSKWDILAGVPAIDRNELTVLENKLTLDSGEYTLIANGWTASDDIYVQTLSVSGLKNTDIVIVGYGSMTKADKKLALKAQITCVAQGTNTLTFEAEELPTINVPVNVVIQGNNLT